MSAEKYGKRCAAYYSPGSVQILRSNSIFPRLEPFKSLQKAREILERGSDDQSALWDGAITVLIASSSLGLTTD